MVFIVSGGTPHPGATGSGEEFILDDLYFVPEQVGPPIIWAQPQSQTVPFHSNAVFGVYVTGSPTLQFQWALNGTNIGTGIVSGPFQGTLMVPDVEAANAGTYTVTVSNAYGLVQSAGAVLTVGPAPPQIEIIAVTGNSLNVQRTAVEEVSYQLQYATNLSAHPWVNFGPILEGVNGTYHTSLPIYSNAQQFYRLQVTPMAPAPP